MALARDYPGPWYVYRLIDPQDGLPFYVGLSIDPHRRLSGHMSIDSPCRPRLRAIRAAGLRCEVEVVSEHSLFSHGRVAEQALIRASDGLVNRDRHVPFWPGCARGEPPQHMATLNPQRDWILV